MGLPWVRLDANIGSHDKVLYLIADPSKAKWQALASYMVALGWSGANGTDGFIPTIALPFVHGNAATARLLVKHKLWDEARVGYSIRNYAERQQSSAAAESVREAKQRASRKGNCVKHHGASCGCWETAA
jgi:hypothetical protein